MKNNYIKTGDSRDLINELDEESISLSLWSPPYFVGKDYEKDNSLDDWVKLLEQVIECHSRILIPGGFMVINIADIKCFSDENIPKYQTNNVSNKKSSVTREMVLKAKSDFPEYNRNK